MNKLLFLLLIPGLVLANPDTDELENKAKERFYDKLETGVCWDFIQNRALFCDSVLNKQVFPFEKQKVSFEEEQNCLKNTDELKEAVIALRVALRYLEPTTEMQYAKSEEDLPTQYRRYANELEQFSSNLRYIKNTLAKLEAIIQ